MPGPRVTNLLIFAFCLCLIGTALFMQHVMGWEPCYLCITQRIFVILTGVIALVAFLHNPATVGHRIYGALTGLSALTGGFFSARHVWIQHLPKDQVPTCGPPAEYLFEAFPIDKALSMLLEGDGNCAEIQWSLFGVSIPGWTFVALVILAALSVWQLVRSAR